MAWDAPLWSLGGIGIYVAPDGDSGWQGDSGDAQFHVLHSHETTVHDVGQGSATRQWRGLVRGQANFAALEAMRGRNVAYVTPMTGDTSGTCRVINVQGRSMENLSELLTSYFRVTVDLMER